MARIDDGYRTLITFSETPITLAWEKSVTPPGIDGGGSIDITTMRNGDGTTGWRTFAPKALKTLTESTATCAYDPEMYDECLDALQVNQLITITFPDGATEAFWGWLDKFMPGELVEGEQPTAEITIVPSNWSEDTGLEVAPVNTPGA
jgi:hypothetical protein